MCGIRRVGAAPRAPATDLAARPEQHAARALPVEGDEVEARRGRGGGTRPHDSDREVLRDDRGVGGASRGRRGDQEQQDEAERLHVEVFGQCARAEKAAGHPLLESLRL